MQIKRNLPLSSVPNRRVSKYKILFDTLGENDCIVCSKSQSVNLVNYARSVLKIKVTARRLPDGQYGIWIISDENKSAAD